jgi:uncharacterized membrane protein
MKRGWRTIVLVHTPLSWRRGRSEENLGGNRVSFLDLFAGIVLILLVAIIVAVFVALGMLPGYIARTWAEAVAVGGWATLIFGFVFWPLVLIWAYVDAPPRQGSPR